MNWLAKTLWALLLILCVYCTKEGVLDETFVQGLSTEVEYKNFPLPLKTIRYPDSLYTGATPYLLTGKSQHRLFGEIESIARSTVVQANLSDIIINQTVSYDSIRIALNITYVQGLRKGEVSLKMFPLKEAFVVQRQYFSTSTIPYYKDSLVLDKSFTYEVDEEGSIDTTIYLHAEELWGKSFLKQAVHKDQGLNFLLNYPGFVFVSTSATGMLGINPQGSGFTLYYKVEEEDNMRPQEKSFLFQRRHYNQYITDLQDSRFSSLKRGEATVIDDYAYAYGALGVLCSVDLTPLRAFYESQPTLQIVAARLKSRPMHSISTTSEVFSPPQALRLSLPFADPKDSENVIQKIITREVVNDRVYVNGETFFNKVDDSSFPYQGTITLALRSVFSEESATSTWLLSAEDYRGIEPVILPAQGLFIDLFYTLNN